MTKVQPIGQRGPSGRGHLVLPLPPSAQYLVSIQLVDEHVCEQLAPPLSLEVVIRKSGTTRTRNSDHPSHESNDSPGLSFERCTHVLHAYLLTLLIAGAR